MVHDLLNTHDHLQEGRRQNCGTCTKNEEKVTRTKEREQKETTKKRQYFILKKKSNRRVKQDTCITGVYAVW